MSEHRKRSYAELRKTLEEKAADKIMGIEMNGGCLTFFLKPKAFNPQERREIMPYISQASDRALEKIYHKDPQAMSNLTAMLRESTKQDRAETLGRFLKAYTKILESPVDSKLQLTPILITHYVIQNYNGR